jgi:hypothetical protein
MARSLRGHSPDKLKVCQRGKMRNRISAENLTDSQPLDLTEGLEHILESFFHFLLRYPGG